MRGDCRIRATFWHPFLVDPSVWDRHLGFQHLNDVVRIRGALSLNHTEEFLWHAGLIKELVQDHDVDERTPGTNTALFVQALRGETGRAWKLSEIAKDVNLSVREAGGAVCMSWAQIESYLSGSTRGKHYVQPVKASSCCASSPLRKILQRGIWSERYQSELDDAPLHDRRVARASA